MAQIANWDFKNEQSLVDSVNSVSIAPDCTNPACVRNASGYVESVATDAPGYHYAIDGTCLGLQIHGSSTQRLTNPEDLSDPAWFTFSGSLTHSATTDPRGAATSASYLTDDNTGSDRSCYIYEGLTLATNQRVQIAAFVRKRGDAPAGLNYCYLRGVGFSGVVMLAHFDLDTMTTVSKSVDIDAYGIEPYADDWYRIWIEVGIEADAIGSVYVGMNDNDDSGVAYVLDGRSMDIWGITVQDCLELSGPPGALVPYSPSSIGQHDLNLTDLTWWTQAGSNLSYYEEIYNPCWDETVALEHRGMTMGTVADSTFRVEVSNLSGGDTRILVQNNPGTIGSINIGIGNPEAVNRLCFTVANNDLRGSLNGAAVVQDTSVDFPLSDIVSDIRWNWYFGNQRPLNGIYGNIVFFDSDITDADLVTYTTDGLTAYGAAAAFPGTVAGDGGVIWPARANDPRWAQIITDSGITATGNFQGDVKLALLALSGQTRGGIDDLWKRTLIANSITDYSEPFLY